MSRIGTQTLLKNINTNQSCKILISKRLYYHPYIRAITTKHSTSKELILYNSITINDIIIESIRCESNMDFVYRTKDYSISFVRWGETNNNTIAVYIDVDVYGFTVYIDQGAQGFAASEPHTEFTELANSIVETTITEIYRNHLATIQEILRKNDRRYKRKRERRVTHTGRLSCQCRLCME